MMDHAKLAQLLFPQVTETPQQLLEQRGRYYELYEMQFQREQLKQAN